MPRGFSPLKVKERMEELIETGEVFTLVDEGKRLNLTSRDILAIIKKQDADAILTNGHVNYRAPAGNYARYQFVKEGIRT